MRSIRTIYFAVLLLLAMGVAAQGLPTASLTGRVTSDGAPLPGVTIEVTSPNLQGTRSAISTESGDYIFHLLPPGEYGITYTLSGMQGVKRKAILAAAAVERIDISFRPSASEEITVSADAPVTGALASTEVGANFNQELINELPVSRDVNSVTLLSPGVTNNGAGGAVMISGAMSFENLWLINGVTINENLRSTPQDVFIEDAIQETTVLTAGVSAEYGRFTGGVVNAITKSGTNDLRGSYRLNLSNESWAARTRFTAAQADSVNHVHEATIGGPALRDRLWFFLAGRMAETNDIRQTYTGGLLAGDQNPTPLTWPHGTEETRLEGKGTFSVTSRHTITASYTDVAHTETNRTFVPEVLDLASIGEPFDTPKTLLSANYGGVLGNKYFIEAQYSRRTYDIIGGGSPFTDLIQGTVILDRGRGARYNSATFRRPKPESRDNRDYLLKGSAFFGTRYAGSHDLKIGVEDYDEIRNADNYQTGSDWRISTSRTIIRGSQVFPVFASGTTTRIEYRPVLFSSEGSHYRTRSAFVNDTVRAGAKWTFNVGLRYDQNSGTGGLGQALADDSAISPRLGAHYDLRGDGGVVINASYGQYVSKYQEGVDNDADPAGRNFVYSWNYRGPGINTNVNTPTAQLIPTDRALQMLFDWLNSQGGRNARPYRAVTLPGFDSRIADDMAAPVVNEATLGLGSRITKRGYVRVDLIHREWNNFYTQIVNTTTGKTPPTDAGTLLDMRIIDTTDAYEREYDAVQTQFRFEPWRRLRIGGNYTWSHLRGNVFGESTSGPETGDALSYPEYKQESWNHPMGDLAQDQRHRLRMWAGYDFRTPIGRFNVSVLQRFDSGSPYSATQAIDSSPYVTNPGYSTPPTSVNYFFGGRGGYRTENLTRTDFAVNYKVHLIHGIDLFIEPEIINLFNEQGSASVNSEVVLLAPFNPFTTEPVEGVHWRKGDAFGQAVGEGDLQTPRTFRLSIGLRF